MLGNRPLGSAPLGSPGDTDRTLSAGTGSFTFTGCSVPSMYYLRADTGSFTFTGVNAEMGRVLSAGVGSFTFSGQSAELFRSFTLPAGVGSFALTGAPQTLVLILSESTGNRTFTGVGTGIVQVPSVASMDVGAWGGGASGFPGNFYQGGAGGGYAGSTVTVTAGQYIYFSVGAGGAACNVLNSNYPGSQSWVNKSTNAAPSSSSDGVRASGGSSNVSPGTGLVGTTTYTGGSGAQVTPAAGGGGGGAGSAGNGVTATTIYGANGGASDGGKGGDANTPANYSGSAGGGPANAGQQPGGGGGGNFYYAGLPGGAGQVKFTWARNLVAGAGSFTLTGQSATLEKSSRQLLADVGAFTLTGQNATLARGARELIAGTGAFALTGQDATLEKATVYLAAGAGAFTLTGNSAELTVTRTWSGTAAADATGSFSLRVALARLASLASLSQSVVLFTAVWTAVVDAVNSFAPLRVLDLQALVNAASSKVVLLDVKWALRYLSDATASLREDISKSLVATETAQNVLNYGLVLLRSLTATAAGVASFVSAVTRRMTLIATETPFAILSNAGNQIYHVSLVAIPWVVNNFHYTYSPRRKNKKQKIQFRVFLLGGVTTPSSAGKGGKTFLAVVQSVAALGRLSVQFTRLATGETIGSVVANIYNVVYPVLLTATADVSLLLAKNAVLVQIGSVSTLNDLNKYLVMGLATTSAITSSYNLVRNFLLIAIGTTLSTVDFAISVTLASTVSALSSIAQALDYVITAVANASTTFVKLIDKTLTALTDIIASVGLIYPSIQYVSETATIGNSVSVLKRVMLWLTATAQSVGSLGSALTRVIRLVQDSTDVLTKRVYMTSMSSAVSSTTGSIFIRLSDTSLQDKQEIVL